MRYRIISITAVILLAVIMLSGCGAVQVLPTEVTEETLLPAAEETVPHTVPQTEAATEAHAAITAPKEFTELTKKVGASPQKLAQTGCSQIVAVRSEGSSAEIGFYYLDGSAWKEKEALRCSGYTGAKGVVSYEEMKEGESASPFGIWRIGEAFYHDDEPQTGLKSFKITEDTFWVDDPGSVYYNQRVVGYEDSDWDSAEQMYYITPQYNYGFVFDFNSECVPGKGSAFFFHVAYAPTAGCIGASEDMVLAYLAELSADAEPQIIIV